MRPWIALASCAVLLACVVVLASGWLPRGWSGTVPFSEMACRFDAARDTPERTINLRQGSDGGFGVSLDGGVARPVTAIQRLGFTDTYAVLAGYADGGAQMMTLTFPLGGARLSTHAPPASDGTIGWASQQGACAVVGAPAQPLDGST